MLSQSLSFVRSPAMLPPGQRVYAIGDSHGCADRLARLHDQIAADAACRPIARAVVVHLGDYVDRGPDSAGVLALLQAPRHGLEAINLLGNHEQLMLDALDPMATEEARDLWLANGGRETLASYGASARDPRSWLQVPDADLALLRSFRTSFAIGGYVFAHAGLLPGVPLDQQRTIDLLWIREPFLSWRGRLPTVVVHGHTPADAPQILPHRIGIDTGAVFGGPLTCGVLEADRIGFISA